jgi:hypothetical protein
MGISRIKESPALFPMISFCNLKTLNITAASSYIDSNKNIFNKSILDYASPYDWISNQKYAIRNLINSHKNLTDETKKSLGYKIEDMLVSCYFNYAPCTINNFTYFYHQMYGNCYSFK